MRLKLFIANIREAGSSPFDGINIYVMPLVGAITESVPDLLKMKVKDRPHAPQQILDDSWEFVKIMEAKM